MRDDNRNFGFLVVSKRLKSHRFPSLLPVSGFSSKHSAVENGGKGNRYEKMENIGKQTSIFMKTYGKQGRYYFFPISLFFSNTYSVHNDEFMIVDIPSYLF